jgi:predicted DNA-binding protein YlxM (UPF0122 family)
MEKLFKKDLDKFHRLKSKITAKEIAKYMEKSVQWVYDVLKAKNEYDIEAPTKQKLYQLFDIHSKIINLSNEEDPHPPNCSHICEKLNYLERDQLRRYVLLPEATRAVIFREIERIMQDDALKKSNAGRVDNDSARVG